MIAVAALPAAILFAAMFTPPESPRRLLAHDRPDEARLALARVRAPGDDLDAELAAVAEAARLGRTSGARGWRGLAQH